MALKIDQEYREPMSQQQLRPRQHGGTVSAYGVEKKHDRRVAALIEPPAGDCMPWTWQGHHLSREAGGQRNRVVYRPNERGAKEPGGRRTDGEHTTPNRDEDMSPDISKRHPVRLPLGISRGRRPSAAFRSRAADGSTASRGSTGAAGPHVRSRRTCQRLTLRLSAGEGTIA